MQRGLPLDGEVFLRSAHGAARRHAAFLARSAVRRRARELRIVAEEHDGATDTHDVEGAPLSELTPTLRTTLLLLFLGLEKAELRAALGVNDAALRKRLQSLRELGPLARPELPTPSRTPAVVRARRAQVDVLPRLEATRAGDVGRVLGASDPDGHGLIFAEALTAGRATATSGKASDAPPAGGRTRERGSSCSTVSSRTSPSSSS
ncbi:hypothetical protein DB32_008513 [Sandaracinus amylolyticus]|uniref:Uncharacterized protein n=1 Tax=Sandaracinus amylolyticus TaxID=927083 RepID=A0A0F6SI07_9BACT|nr:hypothetical protein DB32_008513 [Sandaracinus amylolyticus]